MKKDSEITCLTVPLVALIEELKYFQPRHRETNFLSEGVRLGLDKEKVRMGHT
jgi:hypothetical protein